MEPRSTATFFGFLLALNEQARAENHPEHRILIIWIQTQKQIFMLKISILKIKDFLAFERQKPILKISIF